MDTNFWITSGALMTVAIVCGSILFTLVITAVGIAIPILILRSNRKRADVLMQNGTQGEATVLALEDTMMRINGHPSVRMTLEIRMPYRAPYQIQKTMTVPLIRLAQVQPGCNVAVMVDLSDPMNPDQVGLLLK